MLTSVFWTCTAFHLLICTAVCKDDYCCHCLDMSCTTAVTKFRYSFPNTFSCHPSKQLVKGQICFLGSSRIKTIPTARSSSVCLIQVQQAGLVCPDGRWHPQAKRCMLTYWSFPSSSQLWLPVSLPVLSISVQYFKFVHIISYCFIIFFFEETADAQHFF